MKAWISVVVLSAVMCLDGKAFQDSNAKKNTVTGNSLTKPETTMFNFFSRPTYATISPSELKKRLQNKDKNIVLLDVREPYEHAEKNIPNSILIPLGTLPKRVKELEPYKDKEIIVYCRSGNRSGQACDYLQKLGFKVANLEGGMLAW